MKTDCVLEDWGPSPTWNQIFKSNSTSHGRFFIFTTIYCNPICFVVVSSGVFLLKSQSFLSFPASLSDVWPNYVVKEKNKLFNKVETNCTCFFHTVKTFMISSRKIAAASEILKLPHSLNLFLSPGLSCSWALLSLLLLASGDHFLRLFWKVAMHTYVHTCTLFQKDSTW